MKQPYRSSKPQYRARVEAMQYMNQISRAYAFTNPVICSEHTWNGEKKKDTHSCTCMDLSCLYYSQISFFLMSVWMSSLLFNTSLAMN